MNDAPKQLPLLAKPTSQPAIHHWMSRYRKRIISFTLILLSSTLLVILGDTAWSSIERSSFGEAIIHNSQTKSMSRKGKECVLDNAATDQMHPDNAGMRKEHKALLALVPVERATYIARSDGSWSNPSTWCQGRVPGKNADVLIPTSTTVTYAAQNTEALHTLRIDGTLKFATNQTTKLVVDTIVVSPTGTWSMGTASHPIANNVTATVIFADNGPIDSKWDPLQLSRGLLSHGIVNIYGAAKTTFLPLAIAPKKGTVTLQLGQEPMNWQVGDIVVLTGSQPGRTDEVRTIEALSGTNVTLNAPLQYDRTPPTGLSVYLANYTHNIVFKSANSQDISRRGHIMFMHSNRVSVNYAQMYELGRTNKAQWADDPGIIRQGNNHTTQGKGLNPRGRYALHFHFAGTDKGQPPAVVRGNAVYNSPGWGFVNHESYVTMEDNAAYNVLGAAFVGEDGNEIGTMAHNIAIGSDGSGKLGYRRSQGPHNDPALLDMWHGGHGFAFRGQAIEVKYNVCSNQAASCYVWNNWDVPKIPMPRTNVPPKAIVNNEPFVNSADVPITMFHHNEAFATTVGVDLDDVVVAPSSNTRHLLEDLTIWNVGPLKADGWGQFLGITLKYAGHVTIQNARISNNFNRIDPHQVYTGIAVGPGTDAKVVEANINGFNRAINNLAGKEGGDAQLPIPTLVINSTLVNNESKYATTDPTYLKEVVSSEGKEKVK